jgi:hypothetical protein
MIGDFFNVQAKPKKNQVTTPKPTKDEIIEIIYFFCLKFLKTQLEVCKNLESSNFSPTN